MNLHEYQAKALLKKYGMPVQEGVLATTPEEAVKAFETNRRKICCHESPSSCGWSW